MRVIPSLYMICSLLELVALRLDRARESLQGHDIAGFAFALSIFGYWGQYIMAFVAFCLSSLMAACCCNMIKEGLITNQDGNMWSDCQYWMCPRGVCIFWFGRG